MYVTAMEHGTMVSLQISHQKCILLLFMPLLLRTCGVHFPNRIFRTQILQTLLVRIRTEASRQERGVAPKCLATMILVSGHDPVAKRRSADQPLK